LVILQGQPRQWSRVAESGREVIRFFCDICGTRLFHNPTHNPSITNIKPGTLDDTHWLQPVSNLWTGSAQPWVTLSESMANYAGQPTPDEFLHLYKRFSAAEYPPSAEEN
jgi:hypothetical protein